MARWKFGIVLGIQLAACTPTSGPATSGSGNGRGGSGGSGASGGTSGSGTSGNGGQAATATGGQSGSPASGGTTGTGGDTTAGGGGGAPAPTTMTGGTGGGSSAGTGGTPGPDTGVPAAAACPPSALVCDDFEKYDSAGALAGTWKVATSGAQMAVDASKPFRGGKALHITKPAGTGSALISKEGAPLFPIAGNSFHGRMMVFITQAPTGGVHWNNIQSAGTIPGSTQNGKYGWGGMYGTIMAGYTVRGSAGGAISVDCSKSSMMGLPEKRWVCVEWKFDGAADEMHYWFDGKLLADVDIVKTGTKCVTPPPPGNVWHAPLFSNLQLGWAQYQTSPIPVEMWIDDVAISVDRIGCPAAAP